MAVRTCVGRATVVGLDCGRHVAVEAILPLVATVHFVVDVNGYFR
jgi:hypothetical protein